VVRDTKGGPLPAERLLDAAGDLFDREGIRAVGVDRLIDAAAVARASLYQHFGSKDGLVVAWLTRQDERDRAGFDAALDHLAGDAAADPETRIRTFFEVAAAGTRRRNYRGCLYVNALTEVPDAGDRVADIVTRHRHWMRDELAAASAKAGAADPGLLADHIQLLYDGALVGAKTAHSVEPIRVAEELAVTLLRAAVSAAP
jgi:AcrR family transcriptional regulator